jgi:hypothetical protein
MKTKEEKEKEVLELELRKVKALEKISKLRFILLKFIVIYSKSNL